MRMTKKTFQKLIRFYWPAAFEIAKIKLFQAAILDDKIMRVEETLIYCFAG